MARDGTIVRRNEVDSSLETHSEEVKRSNYMEAIVLTAMLTLMKIPHPLSLFKGTRIELPRVERDDIMNAAQVLTL